MRNQSTIPTTIPKFNHVKFNSVVFRYFLCFFSFLAFTAIFTSLTAFPAFAKDVPYTWVELGPGKEIIARAVTTDKSCPTITFGKGSGVTMKTRWGEGIEGYPIKVCEASVPAGTKAASVDGVALPLLKEKPTRILVIGDTGCRIKDEYVQDCNNPEVWPLVKISALAAAWKPDLVIHVGDVVYRETSCPAESESCQGSPYGDNWPSWEADFFKPARELLKAAPWIFIRGNHEICTRGGTGWFLLLYPGAMPAHCTDYTAPYPVEAGAFKFVVLDSSKADDKDSSKVSKYSGYLDAMDKYFKGPFWLLTHKPVWGVVKARGAAKPANGEDGSDIKTLNPTLETLFNTSKGKHFLSRASVILSGHIHLFEALTFKETSNVQLVIGNSGTTLDEKAGESVSGLKIGGYTLSGSEVIDEFGYTTLEPDEMETSGATRGSDGAESPNGYNTWKLTEWDQNGKVVAVCTLGKGVAKCKR